MRTVGATHRNDAASASQGLEWGENGAAFHVHLAPRSIPSNVTADGIAQLSPITLPILLGEVEDRAFRRRKAVQRGAGMLALLDLLRDADLGNETVPADLLDRLGACLKEGGSAEDAERGGVLQEIETRVQVELARRGR